MIVKNEDAKAFFEGKRDGIFVRRWTDAHNREVIDKAYFRIDGLPDEQQAGYIA